MENSIRETNQSFDSCVRHVKTLRAFVEIQLSDLSGPAVIAAAPQTGRVFTGPGGGGNTLPHTHTVTRVFREGPALKPGHQFESGLSPPRRYRRALICMYVNE